MPNDRSHKFGVIQRVRMCGLLLYMPDKRRKKIDLSPAHLSVDAVACRVLLSATAVHIDITNEQSCDYRNYSANT